VTVLDDLFSGDEFHYFLAGKGNDRMVGNGSAVIAAGGLGRDEINVGIVDPAFIGPDGFSALVYGDLVRPGFGHPASVTAARDHYTQGGDDILHIGFGIWAVGGPGADTYEAHGPMPDGFGEAQIRFDPFEGDTIILDNTLKTKANPNGITFSELEAERLFTKGGHKYVEVAEFEITGHSRNAMVREQNVEVRTDDDLHGKHHPYVVEYHGAGWTDDVKADLEAHVGDWFL
jgi:hypothetical protein